MTRHYRLGNWRLGNWRLGNWRPDKQRMTLGLSALLLLLLTVVSAAPAQAATVPAPTKAPTAVTVILEPTDDARTQPGSPNTNFDDGFLWMGHPNVHFSLLKFDLSVLPVDATITGADLQLYFTGMYTGTNQIEVGRVNGAWEEETLTGSTPVTYNWSGQFQTVTSTGKGDGSAVTWNVAPLVQLWHNGTIANEGLALRGNGGDLKAAHSKETGEAADRGPKLRITYTVPADDGQPRPDLGDAPDSTNHHGLNNTAYLNGTLGQFPTVYNVPANQAAGPLHHNQTMEGWLGDFISREEEADQGNDQDTPRNNILRNSVTGAVGNVADNDRGDDGWRNRNLNFFDCDRTQLKIRVSKAPNATLTRMYLNAWFDGNRDGDWSDLGQCQADEDQPAQASYEWIVQNYIVDMTAVPAGGSFDFMIPTEKVLNSSGIGRHWMRFTLSDTPATQPLSGTDLPDGRGPHPSHPTLKAFQYGETEDVVQRSLPATSTGTLEIFKRVVTDGEPVEWIDYVTYEILLRHTGGAQPLQARLRDLLPYPLIVYPTINGGNIEYIHVESPTGGATPLQAQLDVIPPSGSTPPQQVIKWQGSLAPNAEIKFTFQVRVLALCQPNQQTLTFTNTALARPKGGTVITASDTFTAKCIDYDESNVDVELQPVDNPTDWDDLIHIPVSGTLHNRHAVSVTVGLYQKPLGSTVTELWASAALTTTKPTKPIKLYEFPLQPGETKPFVLPLRLDDESSETIAGESVPVTQLAYCIMLDDSGNCPDATLFPKLHGLLPVNIPVRPSDLGDAPDSTNHAGAAMAAYPGTPADFPTVFDPATAPGGLPPQGPRHLHPRPFHLGQRVSRELEADIGPDQDPLNNLIPAANDPDNDRFDDGSRLRNLANCQSAAVDVQVAIAPIAVNYFQQLGTPAYLNVWIDSNRDGDWADGFTCQDPQGQNQTVVEHILIDQPINVVGLGAGLHNLANLATQRVLWPAQLANRPAWVRFTLSDRPSNKTLNFGGMQYGDGRGYALAFKVGETEDHYRYYNGDGVDLAVQVAATSQPVAQQGDLSAAAADQLGNFEIQMFQIEVTNLGGAGVNNALLEFQIPEKFRGIQPRLIRAPGVKTESISFNFDKLSFVLPSIEQANVYQVLLGWYGCITCTVASNASAAATLAEYTGVATVTATGDADSSNNQSSATARNLLRSPIIGGFMDYTDDACMDRIISGPAVTNRTSLQLRGTAAPNQIIAILIGLLKVAEVTSDANGNFSYTANLGAGMHEISARYASITSPRDMASGLPTGRLKLLVNPSLPFDPLSICFVDSNGRSYAVPTLGYSFGATQTGTWLRSGESYKVSLNATGGNLNRYFKVTFEDVLISSLTDENNDGLYQGLVVMPDPGAVQSAGVQATATLGLIVGDGATERTFSTTVEKASPGLISDRSTGQPLVGASVAVVVEQATSGGQRFFTTWSTSQSGQANPQVTGADGKYSYSANNGTYRIDVVRDGYQPYRSGDIDASTTSLNLNIALSPAVAEATTQQILITSSGFQPATLNAKPGDVIEFINVDLADHSTMSSAWDSGLLAAGQSYKVKLTTNGSYTYSDANDGATQGVIVVGESVPADSQRLFLPLVTR